MANSEISIDEFYSLVRPLVGMPVSLPWKGYGSAIFLELGVLAPLGGGRRNHNKGEACISVYWDWRIEEGSKVLSGSSNCGDDVEEGLKALLGAKVDRISITEPIRELVIAFSNGHRLRSMVMLSGNPAWDVQLADSRWISSKDGRVYAGDGGGEGLSEEEDAVFDAAAETARRWGKPSAEPKTGSCCDCKSYIPLAGRADLHYFGVCVEPSSPLDGRAVNCGSGCPAFVSQ